MKKFLVATTILALAMGFVGAQTVKNPDTFVTASFGDAVSLDPAVAYDNVSWAILHVVYSRLIAYDGTSLDKFVPDVAVAVPTVENGGISRDGRTYIFKIRRGIRFQNGDPLTAEDVAYSIKRNLVLDPDGGPAWIWYNIFLGSDVNGSRGDNGKINVKFADIDKAIQARGDEVIFKLKDPFPAFISVMAGDWASIVDRKFVMAHGGWNGSAATWEKYNNPATGKEALYDKADGSGPYKLDRWDKNIQIKVERFPGYFGKKPALKYGIRKVVTEWSTRKLMLEQGDVDYADVNATNYPEMANEQGITAFSKLPTLQLTGIHFNMQINTKDNPATYSGQLDGQGIPANFFADPDVRLGFTYAWDEQTALTQIMNGNAVDPVTPYPVGLPYKNMALKSKPFDLNKAAEHFKKAFGGQLWQNGFKLDILYNTGNQVRELCAKMLAENLSSINPKFQVNVRGVEWAEFTNDNKNKQLAIYFMGWNPDYPDPSDYANPYQSSGGYFAGRAGYNNPEADKLVAAAAIETNPAKRQEMYYKLQDIWLQDDIAIIYAQPTVNYYFKDWVKGYTFNAMDSEPFCKLAFLSK
ncbi:MAG TPA: ABC transporter substrate-binding protein [Rectinemataceae bacterium]|nr:ABC transporter substrate-binding protein [Rectinemataceae bacterium]